MALMNMGSVRSDARVRKEAASLAKAGHEVLLVAKRLPGEPVETSLDGFRLDLVRLRTGGRTGAIVTNLIRYLEFNLQILFRMFRARADVYHAHDLDTLIACWLVARMTGARLIYDAHELYTERPIETPWLWRRVERFLIRRVDWILAANEDRAEVMFREYGAPHLPTVLRNSPEPASGADLSQSTLRDTLPEHLRNRRLLVYQGGLSANRCLEQVVRSAQWLNEDILLVFLGHESGYSRTVLRPMVSELGLESRVHFVPGVDSRQVVHFLTSADLGIVIYRNSCRNNYLCAPNKLFDYCMAGLPCIGCDFPPIRRVGSLFNAIDYFDPESPESIAAAANAMLQNLHRMTEARVAAAGIASFFTWAREEQTLHEVYDKLKNGA